LAHHSFWYYNLVFFGAIAIRYFLIAGGMYWLFYRALGEILTEKRLWRSPPSNRSIRREIGLSLVSGIVFSFFAALIMCSYQAGTTLLYTDLQRYGILYLGFSFITVLILQDAYFYLIHRTFHHPKIFKYCHQGHHRSADPTPWTSFALDVPEAALQALFLVGIVFILPLHFLTLITILMTMTVWTVFNHLGFEMFPPSFYRHWLGQWFIGSTHHSIHHRKYAVHYGLYFTIFDRLFGTQDASYPRKADSEI
jgi:sterol desaturase/sphingolipid hydroxylase (fatty acid hydroxylase superfamily)